MGSNCFYLCFIQLVLETEVERPISASETKMPKCFIVWMDWWMDGWMGGDFIPPSIFLIFKYDNKHDVLISNICLKVAYVF